MNSPRARLDHVRPLCSHVGPLRLRPHRGLHVYMVSAAHNVHKTEATEALSKTKCHGTFERARRPTYEGRAKRKARTLDHLLTLLSPRTSQNEGSDNHKNLKERGCTPTMLWQEHIVGMFYGRRLQAAAAGTRGVT